MAKKSQGPMQLSRGIRVHALLAGAAVVAFGCQSVSSARQGQTEAVATAAAPEPMPALGSPREMLDAYCVTCHNERANTAQLALDVADVGDPASRPDIWERVVRRLRTGTMPPAGVRRPDSETYTVLASYLEGKLDEAWPANADPGRIAAVHRLNRTEYRNAVRDLLGIDMDVTALLPGDETADGSFDNLADALQFTTAHLERYMSVSRQVTRLAVGLPPQGPEGRTVDIPLFVEQEAWLGELSADAPFGSRGGTAFTHHFPADGQYLVKLDLRRQYQEYIMGMGWPQSVDFRIDGELMQRISVGGAPGTPSPSGGYAGNATSFGSPDWEAYMHDAHELLQARFPVTAGPHVVSVTFVRDVWEPQTVPQPKQRGRVIADDEIYMGYAAISSISLEGPFEVTGFAEDTPSRRAIFSCHPDQGAEEVACATEILGRLARRAYRRPVTDSDVQTLLAFFDEGRGDGGSFDSGIQLALERMLVAPSFLLRVYRDPAGVAPGDIYRLNDLQLASRLSFFLWSSIPDEALLDLAERGQLADRAILEQQVRRMLADPRAEDALVHSFAAQWLNLRRVEEVVVDPIDYPQFDANLLEAFQTETELFVGSTIREDRSVLDLIDADYTYVNERLARHYGIPDVYGAQFRRVTVPNPEQRGGLLAHGSILSVSSYPDRTSPVLRGKWVLDNMLGTPAPPPPPGVNTTLVEAEQGVRNPSIRARLDRHRTDRVCNSCHGIIDPPGFALEHFDVIGGWRVQDERGNVIDAVGSMPSGQRLEGFAGLKAFFRSEQFVITFTEKLMGYALGRRLEYYDRPSVRQIVRDAEAEDYRWSAIVAGIVESPAFLMRKVPQVAQ
jgi:cytochrome c5